MESVVDKAEKYVQLYLYLNSYLNEANANVVKVEQEAKSFEEDESAELAPNGEHSPREAARKRWKERVTVAHDFASVAVFALISMEEEMLEKLPEGDIRVRFLDGKYYRVFCHKHLDHVVYRDDIGGFSEAGVVPWEEETK